MGHAEPRGPRLGNQGPDQGYALKLAAERGEARLVLGQAAGTFELSAIIADPPSGTAVDVALVLVLAFIYARSVRAEEAS